MRHCGELSPFITTIRIVAMMLLVVVGNTTHLVEPTNASGDAGLNVVADEPTPSITGVERDHSDDHALH
jgi:hypothetical protein